MPVLIGELEKITGSPSSVTQVMVRAHKTRITGSALTTDELVPIPVDRQGRFEVPLRPGKAVLVLVHGGRVGEGERFPMLVEEGLGTIVSAIKLASDRFDDYELDELERAAADMLASLDKGLVAATRAEVAKEDAEKARDKAGEYRDVAEKAAGTAAADAATSAVQKADEKLSGYVTAAEGHAEDSKNSATSAGKDAGRAEAARKGAETIQQGIPTKIDQELETKLPAELDKHLPGELDERVPPMVASSIADDRAVADAAAAAAGPAVSAAAAGMDLVETDDPRLPRVIDYSDYAAVIGDGEHAALAVTAEGDVIIPRVDESTRAMLLDRLGPADALTRVRGGVDVYPWRVADVDGISPLAIRYDGAVDFRALTPEAQAVVAASLPNNPGEPDPSVPAPAPEARQVWVPETSTGEIRATYLPTGQSVVLADTGSDAFLTGAYPTWEQAGERWWQKTPNDGPWKVAERQRFAAWGSSSMKAYHFTLSEELPSHGITDFHPGGVGWDRFVHIFGRMGLKPFALANPVTVPASSPVVVEWAGVPTTGASAGTEASFVGTLGGVHGTASMEDRVFTFTRTTEGDPITIPSGTEFVPDAVTYRDAIVVLNLGKNDISSNMSAEECLEQTIIATDWLRSLAGRFLILGHFRNRSWPDGDPRHTVVTDLNHLLANHYGHLYMDQQDYLMGSQIWADTGLAPTPEDLASQAKGVVAPSLSADGAHTISTSSRAIVNNIIIPGFIEKGWIS